MFIFFFFKQKTAYELRISDWSSDVCSSDLIVCPARLNRADSRDRAVELHVGAATRENQQTNGHCVEEHSGESVSGSSGGHDQGPPGGSVSHRGNDRADERRVGKECVR